jgi:hypothetical protein
MTIPIADITARKCAEPAAIRFRWTYEAIEQLHSLSLRKSEHPPYHMALPVIIPLRSTRRSS